MIYKFKCEATSDLLMNGPVGDRLLGIVGRPVEPRGILQPDDMMAAIRALELAVAEDETRLSVTQGNSVVGVPLDEDVGAVTLRQHSWPLIEMMKQAQSAHEAIVWGV